LRDGPPRHVDLVRRSDALDVDVLRARPEVAQCWELPAGCLFLEATGEDWELLAPMFRGQPLGWHGIHCFIPTPSTHYRFRSRDRLRCPAFGSSPSWYAADRLVIAGRLRSDPRAVTTLSETLAAWTEWGESAHLLSTWTPANLDADDFELTCTFPSAPADAVMALYMVLCAANQRSFLEAVGFFSPSAPGPRTYLPIGHR